MKRTPLRRKRPLLRGSRTVLRAQRTRALARAKASDSPVLALAKGETRAAQKRREDREAAAARTHCREVVYHRAASCCEHCGKRLVLRLHDCTPYDVLHRLAHIHEEPPRSQGGDPTDPLGCVCLCPHCHADVTGNRLDVLWVRPELRALGGVKFQPRLPEMHDARHRSDAERATDG